MDKRNFIVKPYSHYEVEEDEQGKPIMILSNLLKDEILTDDEFEFLQSRIDELCKNPFLYDKIWRYLDLYLISYQPIEVIREQLIKNFEAEKTINPYQKFQDFVKRFDQKKAVTPILYQILSNKKGEIDKSKYHYYWDDYEDVFYRIDRDCTEYYFCYNFPNLDEYFVFDYFCNVYDLFNEPEKFFPAEIENLSNVNLENVNKNPTKTPKVNSKLNQKQVSLLGRLIYEEMYLNEVRPGQEDIAKSLSQIFGYSKNTIYNDMTGQNYLDNFKKQDKQRLKEVLSEVISKL